MIHRELLAHDFKQLMGTAMDLMTLVSFQEVALASLE
jgi:hypothetical protein